jgi:hypothetical protein
MVGIIDVTNGAQLINAVHEAREALGRAAGGMVNTLMK